MYFTIGSIVGWLLFLGLPALMVLKWKNFSTYIDEEMSSVETDYYGDRPWIAKVWDIMRGNIRAKGHPSKVKEPVERAANAFVVFGFLFLVLCVLKFVTWFAWPLIIILGFVYWIIKTGKMDSNQEI